MPAAKATGVSPTTVGRLRRQTIADEPGLTPDVATEVVQEEVGSTEASGARWLWRRAAEKTAPLRGLLQALRTLGAMLRALCRFRL